MHHRRAAQVGAIERRFVLRLWNRPEELPATAEEAVCRSKPSPVVDRPLTRYSESSLQHKYQVKGNCSGRLLRSRVGALSIFDGKELVIRSAQSS